VFRAAAGDHGDIDAVGQQGVCENQPGLACPDDQTPHEAASPIYRASTPRTTSPIAKRAAARLRGSHTVTFSGAISNTWLTVATSGVVPKMWETTMWKGRWASSRASRSEEHTSELQSRFDL